ncbi:hypothetical protein KI387_024946, partial [Taxus chinensis]
LAAERKREEIRLKYNEACEREIEKKQEVVEKMALWRKIVREGVEIHAEDVEPEPQELPHLRKHDREPSLAS